jgi:hypothetical protein
MAGEEGVVASIVKQEGDRVVISVPMVGFPRGFQLRSGERVVLVKEVSGPAARPLIRSTVVQLPLAKLTAGAFEIDGQPHVLQAASVRDEPSPRVEPGESVVFVVDEGSAPGPKQVIAIRRQRVKPAR